MSEFSNLSDKEITEELERRKTAVSVPDMSTSKGLSNTSVQPTTLTKRYGDAYIVARATNGIGGVFKTVGVFLAILLIFGGFLVFDRLGVWIFIVSVLLAIVIGTLFYLLGVLVSAQGQILKATLDSAVNGSPFLNNEQKARIMSI